MGYIKADRALLYLDRNIYEAQEDQQSLQQFCDEESALFDRQVHPSYVTPFDPATQPQAYADAQVIVGMRAAARYAFREGAAQSNEHMQWFAEDLRRQAAERAALYIGRREGAQDAVENTDGRFFAPYDGEGPVGDSPETWTNPFDLGQVKPGSPTHW